MKCLIFTALPIILSCFSTLVEGTHPPEFKVQPSNRKIVYNVLDAFKLPWIASCVPNCTYTWELNDKPFDPTGTDGRVLNPVGVGTLMFVKPNRMFSGFYKCFAHNQFGTAVSDKVQILDAKFGKFPKNQHPVIWRAPGEPVRMICNRPESVPKAIAYWVKNTEYGLVKVEEDERVSIDPDDGLNFAYVKQGDASDYICVAHNEFLGVESRSNPHRLNIRTSSRDIQTPPSNDNWVIPKSQVFLRGQNVSIKCLYTGNPVPTVTWKRTDSKEMSLRTSTRSYGQELFFESIDHEDAGTYECAGYNSVQPTPITSTVDVTVQSTVQWLKEPMSVTKTENETVTFECVGESQPQPSPSMWFINGELITGNTDERIVGDKYGPSTTLTIKNLKKERDTMAIQCNITNYIGGSWRFKSFYLNVQEK